MQLIFSDNAHSGQYVAKQFFQLSEQPANLETSVLRLGGIDIGDHNAQIQAECHCLYQGKWFLTAFYSHCSCVSVPVDDRKSGLSTLIS
jgi:hypothetical protein